MEDSKLDHETDEPQREPSEKKGDQSSFDIILYPGSLLPKNYEPMILSKMLRSLKYGNEYFKLIENNSYYQNYQRYIRSLLARPGAVVKLAVLSDDYDTVLGWSLVEPYKLHYCYVNKDYRRTGIGRALTKDPFMIITHLTHIGISIWASKYNNNPIIESDKPLVVFDPFA
jgi:GNAT superfamily N-acetyltransferase